MTMFREFISKLTGTRAKSVPANDLQMRRAHTPTARAEASSLVADAAAVPAVRSQHPVEPVGTNEEAPHLDIHNEQELPASWRGIMSDLVRDTENCVVLDVSFRSVIILGTPAFFGSGTHSALLSTLQTKNLSAESEKTTTKEVIAAVRAQAGRAKQQLSARVDMSDASNVQLYKDLLSGAMNLGASDVHILLDLDARSTVRLRLDGKSRDWRTFDTPVLRDALAAGYNGLSIRGTNSNSDWTLDRPINTMTRFFDGKTTINGRLSTLPVTGGAKVVIRVSDGNSDVIAEETLHDSGFTQEQIEGQILPALAREKGFVLVGGSTGAGKSVTLRRMVMSIPDRESKEISAVEDPNEARIPGVAHHSIQRNTDDSPDKIKVMFDSAFTTMMRQDPDIMMVGEIRDRASADLATDAVMTGHLLMVTMHGNSAIGQLFRLMEDRIGISARVLADEEHFALSMAQCLVPLLCKHCKVPAHSVMSSKDLGLLRTKWRLDTNKMWCANGKGCEHCTPEGFTGDGHNGRTVAAEIITKPTPEFLHCLLKQDREGAELAWRKTRRAGFDSPDMQGKTAFENALYHVARGRVSPLALSGASGGKSLEEIRVVDIGEGAGVFHLQAERAA
jgi:type II secretory ATPase GspE/PulE/Tfp pilus assembly ATPase PilB-like protein